MKRLDKLITKIKKKLDKRVTAAAQKGKNSCVIWKPWFGTGINLLRRYEVEVSKRLGIAVKVQLSDNLNYTWVLMAYWN